MVSLASRPVRRKPPLRNPSATAPGVVSTLDPVALAALRLAADHFEQARLLEARAEAACNAAGDDGRWWVVAGNLRCGAEAALVAAILATDTSIPDQDLLRADGTWRRGLGVRLGSVVYLAVPHPDIDPTAEPQPQAVMKLAVVDLAAIHNLHPTEAEGA